MKTLPTYVVLIALVALASPLAGCGNKGPLVLPTAPVTEDAAPSDAPPPGTDPVPLEAATDADTDTTAPIPPVDLAEPPVEADADESDDDSDAPPPR